MSDNLTHLERSEMAEIIKLQGPDITTWALALMTVCVRFIARQISKEGFWYDDCLILLATVSNLPIRVSFVLAALSKVDSQSGYLKLICFPALRNGLML